MFARIKKLRYWKSEHDEVTCEDVYGDDCVHGLFAVADGAGTRLFANIWAEILVTFFVEVPLLSDDPFEVEWWVRQAQERFKQHEPKLAQDAWNARQKWQSEGSQSTLATLHILRSEQTTVQAELLIFGDSCVLIHKAGTVQVNSFPLEKADDFDRPPICIPSKLSIFNRYFHRCKRRSITLEAGDSVMLATDKVARWIVSGAAGRYTPWEAFLAVSDQTVDTWPIFVQVCRECFGMEDDDSTVLLISLDEETEGLSQLGATREHSHEQREQRKRAFEKAVEEQNRELIAFAYGDGTDLAREGVCPPQEEIMQARQVADALHEMFNVLRSELNSPAGVKDVKVEHVRKEWAKRAKLLEAEPCAENLRQTLVQIGVIALGVDDAVAAGGTGEAQAIQLIQFEQSTPSAVPKQQQNADSSPLYSSSGEDYDKARRFSFHLIKTDLGKRIRVLLAFGRKNILRRS